MDSVGLFLSKDPQEIWVRTIMENLLSHDAVERILLRPHPANLDPGLRRRIAASYGQRVCFTTGGPALDDLAQCDLVMAGNSGVHVEAVLEGTLSCFVTGLDNSPFDLLGFVTAGLVYHLQDSAQFEPQEIVDFYSDASWQDVLRIYANIDQDSDQTMQEIGVALGEANL